MKPKHDPESPGGLPAAMALAATMLGPNAGPPTRATRGRIRVVHWQSHQFVPPIRAQAVTPWRPIESWPDGGLND